MTRAFALAFIAMISCAHARTDKPSCIADDLGALSGAVPRAKCESDPAACSEVCEDGDAASCWTRGLQLERDPETKPEATLLFKKACRLGLANGCTNYAAHLWVRADFPAKSQCALKIFDKACVVGDPWACGMVGRLVIEGAADPKVRSLGQARLEKHCEELKAFPCRALAYELESGRLGNHDPARIQTLLARACEGGDTDACGDHATAAETFR